MLRFFITLGFILVITYIVPKQSQINISPIEPNFRYLANYNLLHYKWIYPDPCFMWLTRTSTTTFFFFQNRSTHSRISFWSSPQTSIDPLSTISNCLYCFNNFIVFTCVINFYGNCIVSIQFCTALILAIRDKRYSRSVTAPKCPLWDFHNLGLVEHL